MGCGCMKGLGAWKPVARKGGRREQLRRCGPQCFGDPNPEKPRYPICPPNSCRPTCEGTMRARQRAITQSDFAMERRMIAQGRLLGCPWAKGAAAKAGRGRKRMRRVA